MLFKRCATSVIALIMSRHFLFPIAAVFLIGVAACSKPEEQVSEPDSISQSENAKRDSAVNATQAETGAETETGTETGAEVGADLLQTLRDKAGVVDAEEQAAIVERARKHAKDAALAVGQSELQAEEAADAAAKSAQKSLEARKIP